MLRSVNEFFGYKIRATDGTDGKANDLLFDDRLWTIRYLVDNTGGWLIDRLVLISPHALVEADWETNEFKINLSKKEIEASPRIEQDMPVSRQHEVELAKFYGWPDYWHDMGWGTPGVAPLVPPHQANSPNSLVRKEIDELKKAEYDSHLRSASEVIKYNIEAIDGDIGYVKDLIVDDENWILRYFVIDTKKILPGKKVICAVDWISEIDFSDLKVIVDLTKEKIKNSPEYNPAETVNRKYEEQLYDYYGRPNKWWKT